jgi:hypothetical protein
MKYNVQLVVLVVAVYYKVDWNISIYCSSSYVSRPRFVVNFLLKQRFASNKTTKLCSFDVDFFVTKSLTQKWPKFGQHKQII